MAQKRPRALQYSVLLVEDTIAGESRCRKLLGADFDLLRAASTHEAIAILGSNTTGRDFHAVIVDLTLEREYQDAFPLITCLKKTNPRLPILVWTQHSDDVISLAIRAGADQALKKYVNDKDVKFLWL